MLRVETNVGNRLLSLISVVLQINPQHTVPVLSVDGVNIADSHAIVAYLSERYGKTDRLYPKDLIKRAIVDSRLHFDSSHLFSRLRFIFEPIWHGLIKELPEERVGYVRTSYDILERILADNGPYLCGDGMTIADLCCIASVSTICVLVTIDPKTHPNLTKWIERMSSLPYYEEKNAVGVKKVNEVVGELLKQNQQRQKQ